MKFLILLKDCKKVIKELRNHHLTVPRISVTLEHICNLFEAISVERQLKKKHSSNKRYKVWRNVTSIYVAHDSGM